jgi:hypothetical protein
LRFQHFPNGSCRERTVIIPTKFSINHHLNCLKSNSSQIFHSCVENSDCLNSQLIFCEINISFILEGPTWARDSTHVFSTMGSIVASSCLQQETTLRGVVPWFMNTTLPMSWRVGQNLQTYKLKSIFSFSFQLFSNHWTQFGTTTLLVLFLFGIHFFLKGVLEIHLKATLEFIVAKNFISNWFLSINYY